MSDRRASPLLLNIDAGEHKGEPEELYSIADIVHIACGGHAGDAESMRHVITACARAGTRIGAHPSYVDREGFGRRALAVAPDVLRGQIIDQCKALRAVADAERASITSAKPHGALYHAAHADPEIARACVAGIREALGPSVAIVGLGGGALEEAAKSSGHEYLREAFADRGVRADGSLVPRGEPGAVLDDPNAAAERARALSKRRDIDTLCIHSDTPSSLEIARAVRNALLRERDREA